MPSLKESGFTSRPVPDPTLLTTEQLLRENTWLRELIEGRLDAMDKAVKVQQAILDKIPEQIDLRVAHLKSLHEEKFSSIQTQFAERDTRTEQTQRDSKVAVDAALQAAKEAVGEQNKSSSLAIAKSETSTTKQIDQQAVLITNVSTALDGKINDIKERLVIIEGRAMGSSAAHVETRAAHSETNEVKSLGIQIVVAVIAAVSIVIALLAYMKR